MFHETAVPQSDYYSSGVILYNLCGYDRISEIDAMKTGIFPDIKGRKRENLLEVAFSMMV